MSMMGELNYFLGLQIKQLQNDTFLNQSKYCRDVLKKFEIDSCKEASTPIATSCYLDADEHGTTVDQTKFRGLIGSLLYLTASRPDITFVVCICARFQANPKESHFNAAKRILKYLKGTTNVGLWYPNEATLNLKRILGFRLRWVQIGQKKYKWHMTSTWSKSNLVEQQEASMHCSVDC